MSAIKVNLETHGPDSATLTLTIGPVSADELDDALSYIGTDAFIDQLLLASRSDWQS